MLMKVIYSTQNFTDDTRCIFLGELPILANPIKQLTTSSQLGNNIVFVL